MQQTILEGFNIDVQDMPEGQKALIMTEIQPPTGQTYVLPIPAEAADGLAEKLKGSQLVTAPASALRGLPDLSKAA